MQKAVSAGAVQLSRASAHEVPGELVAGVACLMKPFGCSGPGFFCYSSSVCRLGQPGFICLTGCWGEEGMYMKCSEAMRHSGVMLL